MESKIKKDETVKFNVSMKKNVFEMIENCSEEMGVSRSAFLSFCVTNYVSQQRTLKTLEFLEKLKSSDDVSASSSTNKDISAADLEHLREVLGK